MALISASDIKLLASARMTDLPDGGGQMTGTPLQDGADNNVFPDISSLDRARGAVTLRKIYAAVVNTGADALLGAHVVLEDMPDDAAVGALLIPAGGQAQTLEQRTTTLNSASGFKGAAVTTDAVASGASIVKVTSTQTHLIPVGNGATVVTPAVPPVAPSTSVTAYVATLDPGATTTGWVSSGRSVAMVLTSVITGGGGAPYKLRMAPDTEIGDARVRADAVTGSVTINSVAYSITGDALTDEIHIGPYVLYRQAGGSEWLDAVGLSTQHAITALTASGELMLNATLPLQRVVHPVTAPATTHSIQIPAGSAPGSEVIFFNESAVAYAAGMSRNFYPFGIGQISNAIIDRSTGVITLVVQAGTLPATTAGTQVRVTFAAASGAAGIALSALPSPAQIAAGQVALTLTNGYQLHRAAFDVAGQQLNAVTGTIRVQATNGLVGTYTAGGLMTIAYPNGSAVTGWYGVQTRTVPRVTRMAVTTASNLDLAGVVVSGTTAAGVAFSATSDSAGVFSSAVVSGQYNATTGWIALQFSAEVQQTSVQINGQQTTTIGGSPGSPETTVVLTGTNAADLHGIPPSLFDASGKVPIMASGDVVLLQHAALTTAATATVGATVNCGRTNLQSIRAVDALGRAVLTGYTVDLAAGTLTWTNVAGFSQPMRVRHAIEHLTVAATVNGTSVLVNAPTTRAFPAGSVLSAALLLGDLQARAGDDFSQETWTGAWSDARIGSPIAPQYDQVAHPIEVSNLGCITDRWALIFLTSTTFRVVSEALGQLATGSINSDLTVANPAGGPFLTIRATGWGLGWAAGNVLRVNTWGAAAPLWAARITRPSQPSSAADSLTLAVRGDINI